MKVNPIERYGQHIQGVPHHLLLEASQNEEASILGPLPHKGRQLYFLDLSSGAPSGTFKDWLTCVAVADALQREIPEIAAQTSGNTGNALACYAAPFGIRLTVFYPAGSRYKIDPRFADNEFCRFVELNGTEPEQKELLMRYSAAFDLPIFPSFGHQIESNKLRAYHLRDWQQANGVRIDWHSQALSSAYGVFGFYHGLDELGLPGPSFLGAQQVGMAPYADFVAGRDPELDAGKIFEPTLFRSNPGPELLGMLGGICRRHGGGVRLVSRELYDRRLPELLETYHKAGLHPQLSRQCSEYSEKAPLFSLLAVLEAIDDGQIREGQNVLVGVTGGMGSIPQTPFRAHHHMAPSSAKDVVSMYELRERLWGAELGQPAGA